MKKYFKNILILKKLQNNNFLYYFLIIIIFFLKAFYLIYFLIENVPETYYKAIFHKFPEIKLDLKQREQISKESDEDKIKYILFSSKESGLITDYDNANSNDDNIASLLQLQKAHPDKYSDLLKYARTIDR